MGKSEFQHVTRLLLTSVTAFTTLLHVSKLFPAASRTLIPNWVVV